MQMPEGGSTKPHMDPVADGVLCLQITGETLQQKKCRQRVSTKAPVSEREGI